MTIQGKTRVVVIGAGLGGISASVCLAARGYQVSLFEKNDKIGGKLNILDKDGFTFDLGPSIIVLPHLFRRLFEQADKQMEDYVELQELQPHWRSFFEDGTVIDLHPDMKRMEQELAKLGPGAHGYWAFMDYSRRLWKYAEQAYVEGGADTIADMLRHHSWREIYDGTDVTSSVYQGVARRISHPHLRDMVAFFTKYVGSSPYDAPGTLNLLAYSQMGYGLWYVRGGMYNLARAYQRLLVDLGVEIHLGAEVTSIVKDGRRRVRGVTLDNGQTVLADVVVCNMEVIPAYERLLGESGLWLKRYKLQYEPAASGLVLHFGVCRPYHQLQHHNFFFSRDPEAFLDTIHRRKRLPDDPTIYLVYPTATNPDLAPPGHHIIKALPHIPAVQPDRPVARDDYLALRDRVVAKLERMGLTDLHKHIVVEDMLVPEDLQRLYYSYQGSIYGTVSHRTKNLAFKAPKRSERYDNLYFVGGSVNPGGGTCMAVACGYNAARQIDSDRFNLQR